MSRATVRLLSVTPDALNLLLRTKNTRLGFDADPATWPEEKRQEHLDYMLDTIKSSWEFVDYTFSIEDVTRAFTHQLVRTRAGSYAQESQRTVDVRGHKTLVPQRVKDDPEALAIWQSTAHMIMHAYSALVDTHGVPPQDARGLLPTNILTSIVAKFSLRTLSDMAKVRLCTRTQGEYQDVFRQMRGLVLLAHPWAEPFIQVQCVATGTCAFPRYGRKECPVYHPMMERPELQRQTEQKFWSTRHEAVPVAKDGKAS